MYLLFDERNTMFDFSSYLTTQPTHQGQSLRLSPPRTRMALPAPTPQISGFLADGLPVIDMGIRIPRTLAEFEAILKEIGSRTREEMDAELNDHWAQAHDRLLRFTRAYRAKGA